MSRNATPSLIRLRGVRQNNLKNIDLDLQTNRLHVVTGLSGSGKSSLAFDTLFAEGQRRYIETFSPYARQFFDRMDKPQVDSIEGIPPAIALEQRNSVRTTRSTVGTMTEICDYMKLVWPHLAQLHCRQCHQPVRKDTPASIWTALPPDADILVTFDLSLSAKLSFEETLHLVRRQGYQRILVANQVARIEECQSLPMAGALTVVQDRLRVTPPNRSRFAEACEQAFHFGKGRLSVYPDAANPGTPLRFSQHLHCATCDIDYREPTPALFSFNHPLGACPACRGFGRIITIDYDLVLPDHSRSIAQGVVKPWQSGQSAECQSDMMQFARKRGVPVDVPFADLPARWQAWVIEGDPDYGKDKEHEWPHAWYGVKGYFRWLESKAYKMHVRVLLSRYRSYVTCPDCNGRRFQPDALLYRLVGLSAETDRRPIDPQPAAMPKDAPLPGIDLAGFYAMPIETALRWITRQVDDRRDKPRDPVGLALREVQSRLACLVDVGLGYLTLDRATRTLSGGETQRVNLTSCLGTRLVNTLYVLDEPSVGLHPRDTHRLVSVLANLRDMGNTVVVVEHEANVIQAADVITDLGPGQGERGGQVVFHGTYPQLLKSSTSLTGQYMSGAKSVAAAQHRPVTPSQHCLRITNACRHNLKNLNVEVPLSRLVCVTGVSGSGKTTLVREVLHPLLINALRQRERETTTAEEIEETFGRPSTPHNRTSLSGWEALGRVVLVDQSPVGRTPRSNPAVYTGAFDAIRELFAQTPDARQKRLKASAFSFNSVQGQCGRCRGAGFEKIEMQFLSDVYVRCPQCDGKRYRPHVLEIKLPLPDTVAAKLSATPRSPGRSSRRGRIQPASPNWSIADFLAATVDDTAMVLTAMDNSGPATKALRALRLLQQVGLGYLRLGQPLSTLSGGENQRLKLAGHLADSHLDESPDEGPTLFIFDEPTTGLHFDDVRVLLQVFQRLVDDGHSVLVVEHNLETIRAADWVIDLGPEAGDAGGQLVIAGTPEAVAACPQSHTGAALRTSSLLQSSTPPPRNSSRNRQ